MVYILGHFLWCVLLLARQTYIWQLFRVCSFDWADTGCCQRLHNPFLCCPTCLSFDYYQGDGTVNNTLWAFILGSMRDKNGDSCTFYVFVVLTMWIQKCKPLKNVFNLQRALFPNTTVASVDGSHHLFFHSVTPWLVPPYVQLCWTSGISSQGWEQLTGAEAGKAHPCMQVLCGMAAPFIYVRKPIFSVFLCIHHFPRYAKGRSYSVMPGGIHGQSIPAVSLGFLVALEVGSTLVIEGMSSLFYRWNFNSLLLESSAVRTFTAVHCWNVDRSLLRESQLWFVVGLSILFH